MFPCTPKWTKSAMISFRLWTKWQNCRGYVPCYERTPKNGWFDIHSVFATHVETCCLLVRECANDDEMVPIKVDLEGILLDQGKFEPDEKPTYGNIKKWIKEKYGFNVTNLYIGQIKDKVGMEKRKNYNIDSGEGRVPTCPQEKEEAIMEAFKHFWIDIKKKNTFYLTRLQKSYFTT